MRSSLLPVTDMTLTTISSTLNGKKVSLIIMCYLQEGSEEEVPRMRRKKQLPEIAAQIKGEQMDWNLMTAPYQRPTL